MKRWKKLFILAVVILTIWQAILWATTFKYLYPGDSTYLDTNGYTGGQADLAADGAYDYGADIDLETDGFYGMLIFLEHDSSGTTDDIVLGYFGSYDGSTYDEAPLFEVRCDASSGADLQQSWGVFPAWPHGRLGVKTTGTTDTFDYRITLHKVRGDGT